MTTPDLNILSDNDFLHPGKWWHKDGDQVVCDLCPRECRLHEGDRGFCFVRQNVNDQMVLTTYGRSTGFCIDPIEKKPLNHFYPGTSVLSFGTAGCNLGCKFCQNWDISKSREVERLSAQATPEAIARAAVSQGCHSVAFTYNDPIIWAEYAIDTAAACRKVGVKSVAVTAGYITPQARGEFYRAMDAANVDLKAFTEDFYYKLTLSHLDPVLDTIKWLNEETDVWFEITNLIIPDANDSPDELKRLSDWVLQAVGDNVPVHFSAFHPDYRMLDRPRTPRSTLDLARDIALSVGIKHVYTGNVNDVTRQSTYCPGCQSVVIERNQYALGRYHLDKDGSCLTCGTTIAGHFAAAPGDWGRKRQRVDMRAYTEPSDSRASVVRQTTGDRVFGNPSAAQQHSIQQSSRKEVRNMSHSITDLTDQQTSAALDAAAEYLLAAVEDRTPTGEPLGEMSALPVHGSFVSLKRAGQLRSCCGTIGNPRPLSESLQHSAKRTATDDPRFPPISPSELDSLEMEVWLLGETETVTETGADRVNAVEVGKHGLVIARGENRGLLLPGVPTEYGWDAEQFLGRTCVKAGLPPTAWKEDDTVLQRFPGVVFSRKLLETSDTTVAPRSLFTPRQFAQYAQHARNTVETIVGGGVPMYYLSDVPDQDVLGVGVILETKENADDQLTASRLHWRKTLPMQSTLLSLCQDVAGVVSRSVLKDAAFETWMFAASDAAMHGNAANADVEGLDTRQRGLFVVRGTQTAMVFDPKLDAATLLKTAIEEAGIHQPEETRVFSVQIQTNKDRVAVTSKRRPVAGRSGRPPSVAGRFYPGHPDEIDAQLDQMLAGDVEKQSYAAAMVPHAGWKFSGTLACDVLKRIRLPETVIVLGPKHTRSGVDWAVAPHQSWLLPGGAMESDPELARRLADAIPGLELDAAAHQEEHAIEVELPILRRLAPQTKVLGISVSGGSIKRCDEFAAGLASVMQSMSEPPLLLISSDMNHFANDADTRRLDELALAQIDALDADGLSSVCATNQISMCGLVPAVIVMKTLQRLNKLNRCERVGYATSCDVSGKTDRVVGYAGVLFK